MNSSLVASTTFVLFFFINAVSILQSLRKMYPVLPTRSMSALPLWFASPWQPKIQSKHQPIALLVTRAMTDKGKQELVTLALGRLLCKYYVSPFSHGSRVFNSKQPQL